MAWAVTIHKSQGLTFDRVIIDAGKSFASGQVYVALSRCRTLEGIVLKSKITPDVIFNDQRVSGFQDSTNANDKIEQILSTEKFDYSIGKIIHRLDCKWMSHSINAWNKVANESKKLNLEKVRDLNFIIQREAENLNAIYDKFAKVIVFKTKKFLNGDEEWKEIEQKSKGAVLFFHNQVMEKIFTPLKDFYAETKGVAGLKIYNDEIRTFLDDLEDYLKDLQSLQLLEQPLFEEKNKKTITTKVAKIPTHLITWQMFEQGKTIPEIAKERGILNATVMGHFSKFAETGVLNLDDLKRIVPKEHIEIFKTLHSEKTFDNLTDWKNELPEDFDFGEIRLLWTFFDNLKK